MNLCKHFMLSAVFGLGLTSSALSQVISWTPEYPSATVSGANVAGVVPAASWNTSLSDSGSGSKDNLIDSSGNPTTLDVDFASQVLWHIGGTPSVDVDSKYNKRMLNGYLNQGGTLSSSVTLNEIPYANYSIYVYFGSDDSSRSGTVTDGTTTYSFNVLDNMISGSIAQFAQTMDTGSGSPEANYAVFTNLTGVSQTVSVNIPSWGGISGVQVVSNAAPPSPGVENINMQMVGSDIELTWNSGTLLETTNLVDGPWFTNLNTSPYLFAPMENQKFYRLLHGAGFYTWPEYDPNIAYDYVENFGILSPPTEPLPDGTTGIEDIYTDGWYSFVYGTNRNPLVTENAWIPMVDRFNEDFGYIADVLRWPRDLRAQNGYYSAIYLFGSGLSTDNASNTDLGGWQSATVYQGKAWPMALLSYYPVYSFDPACPYGDAGASQGASIHEGIHGILASMPGCYNSAWTGEAGNTWLQGTMEASRNGDFSGMGWLSAGAAIAQFMPIECYSGWLQDGSFGGPQAQGVYQGDGICTWRHLLGGTQYGECFMYCMDAILGYQSVAWAYANCNLSGRLLQDLAEHPEGLGPVQTRRLIQEFRGRAAMCDFDRKSYAYQQLLHNAWGQAIQEEYSPYWIDVPVWYATCYVATTNVGGTLYPEARTLPGWSGANQIPLNVSGSTASVTFNPLGANMSCQLVYRDTGGNVRYSTPVSSGECSIPLQNVLNGVVIAVICNTDYIYVDDSTRQAKFDYTLEMGTGVTGTADIYTKWFDYNPSSYEVTAVATGPGSISPTATSTVAAGGNISYTITPDPGYDILQVLVGGVPAGPVSNYTLHNVRGDVTVEAQFGEKTYRIFAESSSPVGTIDPAGFTTLYPGDDQGYTVTAGDGWSVYSLKVDGVDLGPTNAYTFTNVQADHNITATFVGDNPSVPQPGSLLYAFSTDTLTTNGVIEKWDAYAPGGVFAFGTSTPTVEWINGEKWFENLYSDGDGFGVATETDPIPCNGATIVVAVKPDRTGDWTSWTSIVDCFYNDLVVGLRNDTGELTVSRKGGPYGTGYTIPDGQETVLSLVVQSNGSYTLYANGSAVGSGGAVSGGYTQLTPGGPDFTHHINIGRGYDGWSTFNGYIGDVYIYTSALSTSDREQLENMILTKFGF